MTVSEITWVPADSIRQAARTYAAAKPAAIQWENPIEHTTHAFETTRALICLSAMNPVFWNSRNIDGVRQVIATEQFEKMRIPSSWETVG